MARREETEAVERWLAAPEVHEHWVKTYYGDSENKRFYESAFDYLIDAVRPPSGAVFLDAGCGNCAHSIRLARRGFSVHAVDFSEVALKLARDNVKASGFEDRIKVAPANLLQLPFEDESYDYVLCWGVLMHIPELGNAISEITRVLRPGGTLIISENNMNSLDSIAIRTHKRYFVKKDKEIRKTPSGIELLTSASSGMSFVRHTNMKWLIRRFAEEGLVLQKRISGQSTGLYEYVPSRFLRGIIQRLDNLRFEYVKTPRFAIENILIFWKTGSRETRAGQHDTRAETRERDPEPMRLH